MYKESNKSRARALLSKLLKELRMKRTDFGKQKRNNNVWFVH